MRIFWSGMLAANTWLVVQSPEVNAQTAIDAKAGNGGYYRSQRWMPVSVNVTHQGEPTRLEVRGRFTQGLHAVTECRIPQHEIRSGANEVHTLYIRTPISYSSQPLTIEAFRNGRSFYKTQPQLTLVNEGDWLVVGVGGGDSTLKLLTTVTLPTSMAAPSSTPWNRNQQPKINVGIQSTAQLPNQWQGLQAADMLVLGDVSERDLTPEQANAIRDYVTAGGHLVVTGGANVNRLTTPFFQQLLPATVAGGATYTSGRGLRTLHSSASPAGSFAGAVLRPKAGAEVLASDGGRALAVAGRFGAGKVTALAFDPSAPPFRNWDGIAGLWRTVMTRDRPKSVIASIANGDSAEQYGYGGPGISRLADAPFSIPQLDIPAFYIVALFLLAYIVVLVPVNYFVLKAKDKKEYAWLTTPAIVLVFSLGAYMIGYGFKGGRTLVVKAGLIDARVGQVAAPNLFYSGLFSPRKTAYEVRLVSDGAGADPAALLSEPGDNSGGPPFKSEAADTQIVSDFAVDMWAMRTLKSEGITRLGKGFTANVTENAAGRVTGTIRNDSPYTLSGSYIVTGTTITPVGELAPGQTVTIDQPAKPAQANGMLLPVALLPELKGSKEELRIKRAVLQPLCSGNNASAGEVDAGFPLLAGWVREPVSQLSINGREPREMSATLMLVHLD